MSYEQYPLLTGETMVWMDIARITGFCGIEGLHVHRELHQSGVVLWSNVFSNSYSSGFPYRHIFVSSFQIFWQLIREFAEKDTKGLISDTSSDIIRSSDPRWIRLEFLCGAGTTENFNRVLFRRPNARLDDMVPGIVSMFGVKGSTIDSEVSPTIDEINQYDL